MANNIHPIFVKINLNMSNFIFVTGAAGFIGSQFCKRLLNEKKSCWFG